MTCLEHSKGQGTQIAGTGDAKSGCLAMWESFPTAFKRPCGMTRYGESLGSALSQMIYMLHANSMRWELVL